MKSSGEKANKNFKFIKNSNKKFELEKCNTPKRRINGNYKFKMDELMALDSKNQDNHSSKKGRKVSISNNNL